MFEDGLAKFVCITTILMALLAFGSWIYLVVNFVALIWRLLM